MESKQELDLRALDAEVAGKVMGWANVEAGCYTPIGKEWCGDDPEGTGGFNRTGRKIIRRYSTDIAAAMEAEDRIAELGLQQPYLQALGPIVAKAATASGEILGYWHFTHATAEQRCRAALAALAQKAS